MGRGQGAGGRCRRRANTALLPCGLSEIQKHKNLQQGLQANSAHSGRDLKCLSPPPCTAPLYRRPTMILYNVDNIRDLFGHKVSLQMVKKNSICRLGL